MIHSLLTRFFKSRVAKIIGLVIIYVVTGKLGRFLAVPPGYSTIIWPPSGIALAVLLLYGPRLWPGVYLGSLLLNFMIWDVFDTPNMLLSVKTYACIGIASGATLQALTGRVLIKRLTGLPTNFRSMRDVVVLLLLTPIICLVSSTWGTLIVGYAGMVPAENLQSNWVAWWSGGTFGMLVFLPLVLLSPLNPILVKWRGRHVETLPALAILAIIIPLSLTFYAWKESSENIYRQQNGEFNTLAMESEKALLSKIASYKFALLGGAGFVQGSDFVSRDEWHTYIDNIDLKRNFPGMKGMGLVFSVKPHDIPEFVTKMRDAQAPYFNIHPPTENRPYNIVSYIEPLLGNEAAIGLNIGFEDKRVEAADRARDTGKASITKKVTLFQATSNTPGFLLLYPIYKNDMPLNNVEERRNAHTGWIYAPFNAKDFLRNLTKSQTRLLNVRIYDRGIESPETLIYDSDTSEHAVNKSGFVVRKKLNIMQQKWLVVWESTADYGRMQQSNAPFMIICGGLLFTAVFALFILTLRRSHKEEIATEEMNFILPIAVFSLVLIASIYLYKKLESREQEFVKASVEQESKKIADLIGFDVNEKFMAIRRMSQRWNSAGGTPYKQWLDDAKNYTDQLGGLKAVEWVDPTNHVNWVEPVKGNERALGLDVFFDKERREALQSAMEKNTITITPPLDLVQGYRGFLVYAPLTVKGKHDGFIVGVFSTDDFVNSIIKDEVRDRYAVSILYGDKKLLEENEQKVPLANDLSIARMVQVYDRDWTVRITPVQAFVQNQMTLLPFMTLVCGFVISLLSAMTVRYILISRVKSQSLRVSEETFRTAMEYASIGMALVGLDGTWLKVNQALCGLLGYARSELLQMNFQSITHPDDLGQDMEAVRQLIDGKISTYKREKRYFHKDGRVIWVLLNVSVVADENGKPKNFIAQIQDITQQREVDRIKSEFISIVSHELRTPLTSIRGSLGLIMGAMAKELPEKAARLIQIAHENSERLIRLINDILDIDKIASGQMHFDMKEEALAPLLQKAADANSAYADKYHVEIHVGPVDPALKITVDSDRMMQVLSNFMSNAAKFSPEGGKIDVLVQDGADAVRISVKDYGPGIPAEFQDRIFGKFMQADSSITRNKGGTGLGLNIAKEMVEHMGGRIGFDTEAGKGTSFWAEFPKSAQTSMQQQAEATPSYAPSKNENLPKILHVEDDTSLIDFFCNALHDTARIVSAGTLQQAREALDLEHFALIILDIAMPDGSGIEFLNYLDETEHKDIPVVILSAIEAPESIKNKVSAHMVKSRMSETKIIEEILLIIKNREDAKNHG